MNASFPLLLELELLDDAMSVLYEFGELPTGKLQAGKRVLRKQNCLFTLFKDDCITKPFILQQTDVSQDERTLE